MKTKSVNITLKLCIGFYMGSRSRAQIRSLNSLKKRIISLELTSKTGFLHIWWLFSGFNSKKIRPFYLCWSYARQPFWMICAIQFWLIFFFFFFNWDSLHDARLNIHYKAWSYKKKKHTHTKLKHTGNHSKKELAVNRCLLILDLKLFRS